MSEEIKEEDERCLRITDQDGKDTFKIGSKGEIFWFNPEKEGIVQAETDADLGKAMALVIMQIAGMDYVRLIDIYLSESIASYKEVLLKKLIDFKPESKSIKKADIMKIISEFKIK